MMFYYLNSISMAKGLTNLDGRAVGILGGWEVDRFCLVRVMTINAVHSGKILPGFRSSSLAIVSTELSRLQ